MIKIKAQKIASENTLTSQCGSSEPGSKAALNGETIPKIKLKTIERRIRIIVSGRRIKNPCSRLSKINPLVVFFSIIKGELGSEFMVQVEIPKVARIHFFRNRATVGWLVVSGFLIVKPGS
ncbi:hypothetical protein [Algoriphagus aquimarinus]|uniref:hypothetical protein n=1 Tax=Algoriphagus aquimarinus TaxID=237018 RepID=UPI0030D9D0DF